jgi:hypothetical protein
MDKQRPKWTAAKLADALAISHTAASKLKAGGRPNPNNARKIVAISNGAVTWEDLYPANGMKHVSTG